MPSCRLTMNHEITFLANSRKMLRVVGYFSDCFPFILVYIFWLMKGSPEKRIGRHYVEIVKFIFCWWEFFFPIGSMESRDNSMCGNFNRGLQKLIIQCRWSGFEIPPLMVPLALESFSRFPPNLSFKNKRSRIVRLKALMAPPNHRNLGSEIGLMEAVGVYRNPGLHVLFRPLLIFPFPRT